MNLGEKIYKLRTERNLSQGDLAEMLEVSRQSVSKWETNGSVPDLDKIIKLSDIFGVTLDELVLGKDDEKTSMPPDNVKPPTTSHNEQNSNMPPRKIAGTILLCMAFLVVLVCSIIGGFGEGLIFSLPFLACGIVCFVCKKNVGLWCGWTIFTIVDVASRYMTGAHWRMALVTFYRLLRFGAGIKLNSIMMLIVSLLEFLGLATLIAVTVVRFSRKPGSTSKRTLYCIFAGWAVLVVLNVPMPWMQWMVELKMFGMYHIYATVLMWARVILFTMLTTKSVQYIRGKKSSECVKISL